MNQDLLAEAKRRLPLSALMAQLGFGDHAKKSARCPFHEDSSASFSVYLGDDGQERWKCHAGCGQGDAIDFLAKHHGLSNAAACREYIHLAGVTPPPPDFKPSQSAQPPLHWQSCVAALTPEHRAKLAEWRGYAPKFVEWLHAENLIGLFEGERIAFPVHAAQCNVLGCHYRLKEDGSWRYHPTGTRTAPFIIGDIATAKSVFVFESQWDLLAVLDAFDWHIQMPAATAAIATRGAANARLLADLCTPDAVVCAFGQNDDPGQTWLAAVAAACGCKCVQVITPPPHKDLNDWTRAGATRADIEAAVAAAQPVAVSNAPDRHVAPPKNVSNRVTLPPDEDTAADSPPPFPLESLPPALAGIVAEVARCERVPASLPAICVLGVASAAIGAGLETVSAADRVTRANLFLLGSAESGSGKSQVFRRIAEPIVEHQNALHEVFRDKTAPQLASEIGLLTREIKRLEIKAAKENTDATDRERMLAGLEYKNARLAELKQKNAAPCVICGDVTSEKLAVMLAANRETLFSASSEARQIVDIVCGRYNATKSTDEEIYLCAFSGDFKRVDRLGRDPLTLRKPCLSVLWLVQPDALSRLFETESLMHSGFLARFLVCPTLAAPQKIVEGQTHAVSDSVRSQWVGLILGLLATYHTAEKAFRIEPSPEAKRLLDDFFNSVVDRRTDELSDVGQFASRYGEQAWRVALTLHAGLHGQDAHNQSLHSETATNAVRVVEWFAASQLDILAKGRRAAAVKVEDEVLESKRQRKAEDFFTEREVHRARITATPDAASRQKNLHPLVLWLRSQVR